MEEAISELFRLKKAYAFLHMKGYNQTKVVKMLNDENPRMEKFRSTTKFIVESTFSDYLNATEYSKKINSRKAWELVMALEKHLKETYQLMWDTRNEEYVSFSEAALEKDKWKLKALFGTWDAYSWDYNLSITKNEGYVHAFKLKVEDIDKVLCATQGTTFKKGVMSLIGIDKVYFELSNSARKAFFIMHIGSDEFEDLQIRPEFILAYVDSGQYAVRSGVMVIRRTNVDYDSIICGSMPISEFKDSWPKLESILRDKQNILTYQ